MSSGSGGVEAVEGCVGRVVGWCRALSGTTPSVSPPRQGQRDSSWAMPKQLLSSIGGAAASCCRSRRGGIMKPTVWMRNTESRGGGFAGTWAGGGKQGVQQVARSLAARRCRLEGRSAHQKIPSPPCLCIGYHLNFKFCSPQNDFLSPQMCVFVPKRCVLSTCRGLDQRWGDHGHDHGQAAMFFGAGRGAGRSAQGLRDSVPGGREGLGTVGSVRGGGAALCGRRHSWQQVFWMRRASRTRRKIRM